MTTNAKWLTGIVVGLVLFVGLLVWMASRRGEEVTVTTREELASAERTSGPPFPTGIKYEVLRDEPYGVNLKWGVYYDVLVSGDVTVKNVDSLLRLLCFQITRRPGFDDARRRRDVWVAAYISREHFEADCGQWFALLTLFREGKGDSGYEGEHTQPSFSVNARQLKYLHAKPEVRFGLSQVQRKEAYKAIWDLEGRADKEAELQVPGDVTKALRIGQRLPLTKETKLSSTLPPADRPLGALAAWVETVGKIPAGATVNVIRRIAHKGGIWYYVEATTGTGAMRTEYGSGYIHSAWLYLRIPDDIALALRKRRDRIEDALTEKYRKETADKYGITVEQLQKIGEEGSEKDWPQSWAYD